MRKLIIAITFGALLLPNQALTLGLGDIEVSSALNQQLDAEIALLSVADGDVDALIVKLASREEFQRAGLDRPFMLSSIKFSTEVRDGVPYIRVTSPKPVREPFLNFLVEVDWPRGHLIREYTLLLDPPIFSNRSAPKKSSIASRPIISEQRLAPSAQDSMQDQGAFRPGLASTQSGTTLSGMDSVETGGSFTRGLLPVSADGYRIQQGDTAWSLAESLRPNSSVSVAKMMLALLRTNPEAFIQENVNGLKRGYILRVPELSEINTINQAEALALVRQQNALWREYQQAMASGQPMVAHDADATSAGEMSTAVEKGRLAIVGVDGGRSQGTDPTAMTTAELRNELALTSEQLETERLEKEGLINRLEALQSQVDSMQGLIDIEDSEMAEMQGQLEPTDTMPAGVEESVVVEKITETMDEASKAIEPPVKPKVVAQPRKVAMPKAEPGLLDDPMILMAGGAILLILLALVVVIIKRRKTSAADELEDDEVADESEIDESSVEEESVAETEIDDDATQIAGEEIDTEENHDETVILQAAPDHEETVITEARTVVTEAITPAAVVEEETDDVIAEADVYLAYGIYQQAEELLQGAIKDNPDKEMYRVKLCETLYASKNTEGFEAAAKEMHEYSAGASTAGWLKVASLGKDLCPDSEMFKNVDVEANIDSGSAESSAPAEMDIDLGDDENAPEHTDVDFDFDEPEVEVPIELPDLEEPAVAETDTTTEEATDEAELEFDIGDTDALDLPEEAGSTEDNKVDDEFSLDIEASELDIDGLDISESAESDSVSLDEKSPGEDDDDFVDDSLDFGLDEIDSVETSEKSSSDELNINLDSDEDEKSSADDADENELNIPMSLDDDDSDGDDTSTDETTDTDDLDTAKDDSTVMLDSSDIDLPALDDVDEVNTKLDLARAYMDMGDRDGTRSILDEVIAEGNDNQKKEAEDLLKELDS